jgi:hypothetical protein
VTYPVGPGAVLLRQGPVTGVSVPCGPSFFGARALSPYSFPTGLVGNKAKEEAPGRSRGHFLVSGVLQLPAIAIVL